MAQTSDNLAIKLEEIEGRWFVNRSNFPMWLKGDKINPQFNYVVINKKGKKCLLDTVAFEKKGKQKTIIGFDTAVDSTNTKFVWRGKGLLALVKSNWKIIHINTAEEWMLIFFEKTLFTPKGYDIISRKKKLSETEQKNIEELLSSIDKGLNLSLIEQK